ncbi:4-hydroxy-tetrahydrodipicolinate synthase [Catenibacillus scindens]|uniref:4-hydroxy-tetrahydrodipicolinate synthase n=1 Tax=Catenibacillus scindens TaxID=673271 RepID=UPI003209C5D4
MAIFKGAGVAIITPMNEDLSVNYEKLEQLIDEQIENGTDAIIICGTTGESSTLTEPEHVECIRVAVSAAKKRVPVIAGTGSNDTKTAVYLTQEAQAAGADAALLVSPYYNKATQKGLIAHYSEIAKNTDLPLILYNIQSRTGVNIAPETIVTLAKTCGNIVAVKEASGNISQIAKLMHLADGCVDLYSGNDDQIVPLLSLGGIGVISVLSNVAPQYTHDIVESYMNGDVAKSCQMQLRAIPLINALFSEVNPIPVKAAMNLMGKEVGSLRLPLTPMEEAHVQTLAKAMEDFGIELKKSL